MHRSTFAIRDADEGWVIDATAFDGKVKQLVGVYLEEVDAQRWITEHPPSWFKIKLRVV